jgi:hypothetical protein
MSKEYIDLANRVTWGNESLIKDSLSNLSLDLLSYKEGKLFVLAINSGNSKVLKLLLDYFHENQLGEYKEGSTEYMTLKKHLHAVLETAIEDEEISEEMRELLSEYINFNDTSSESAREELLKMDNDEFATEDSSYNTDNTGSYDDDNSWHPLLTESNLKNLQNYENHQSEVLGVDSNLGFF